MLRGRRFHLLVIRVLYYHQCIFSGALVLAYWEPRAQHPCNIRKISPADFDSEFPHGLPPLYPTPIVIRMDKDTSRNEKFRQLTRPDTILDNFPANFTVVLSSSNSLSEHHRTVPLAQYLQEISTTETTTADQLSNETWYLFGETYTAEWTRLLERYTLPACRTCRRDNVALSFGIGNRGSGVQWHVHGPGFSEAVHGRKHWILYPPHLKPEYNKDQSSIHWMEHRYGTAAHAPLECTLNPGDLVYFPDRYWHATINLEPYTAFVSTFTTEHGVDWEAEL